MKRILLVIFGLILCSNVFAKTKFSEIKKALKEDKYGKAIPESFHSLNSPKAINPISVSDFSIIGEKSIRFEVNHGECGQEPKHSDCETDRERAELYFSKKPWKKETWYRFFIYLPQDYNSTAPAKMSPTRPLVPKKKESKRVPYFRRIFQICFFVSVKNSTEVQCALRIFTKIELENFRRECCTSGEFFEFKKKRKVGEFDGSAVLSSKLSVFV